MTGTHLAAIQTNITASLNGAIINAQVHAAAAVQERKVAFDTVAGHDHDGTDSKSLATARHYRKGFTLKQGTTPDTDFIVEPGVIDVGGIHLELTADSSDVEIDTETWLNGTNGASQWCYVYVYNNAGSPAFKLSDQPPDLSYIDDTTAEYPLRYQAYSSVYYRCLGGAYIDQNADLCIGAGSTYEKQMSNFDASPICEITCKRPNAAWTWNTIWTPKFVTFFSSKGTAPADGASVNNLWTGTQLMLTSAWYATALVVEESNVVTAEHKWEAATTVSAELLAITSQSAGVAGGVSIGINAGGYHTFGIAYTDII